MRQWMRRWALLLLPLCIGCATYKAQNLAPDKSAGQLPDLDTWEELIISASFPNSSEMVRYFGTDLIEADVLPVILYMQNRSKNVKYEVRTANVEFKLPDGTPLRRQAPNKVWERVAFSHWRALPAYLLLIFPAIFSHLDIADANQDMLHDYEAKYLEDMILPENNDVTVRRALFFRMPRGSELTVEESDYRKGTLSLKVTRYQVSGSSDESPEKEMKIYFK